MERLARTPVDGRAPSARLGCLLAIVCLAWSLSATAQTAPTISTPSNVVVSRGTPTGPIAFTVNDADGDVLTVTAASSNQTLIPNANLALGGSGANRTITVTPLPGLSGQATITLTVSDDESPARVAFTTFVVTVNDAPTISNLVNRTINEDASTGPIDFTVDDTETPAVSLVVTVASSSTNPNLLPGGSITLGGTGSDRTLTVTPAANENGSATLTLTVTDGGGRTDTDSFVLTVNALNDRPTLTGALLGSSSVPILDTATDVLLFANITVDDVDQGRPGDENLTVTVTQDATTLGLGSFENFDTGNIVLTGTPSEVTTALRAVRFDPTPNRAPVGQSADFTVTLSVVDSVGATATNNGNPRSVFVESANDNPDISASLSPGTIPDSGEARPFRLAITDVDPLDESLPFTVTLVPDPGVSMFGTLIPAAPSFTGSRDDALFWVQGIAFRPLPDSVAGSEILTFEFTVTDAHGGVDTAEVNLTLTGQNDPPEIIGVSPNILRITDDPAQPPFHPFAQVRISDADENGMQSQTLTLSVDDPDKGSLSATQLTGTPADVTSLLRNVTFLPAQRPDRVLGETISAILTIKVIDAAGSTRVNDKTVLAITSVNGAPVIAGLPTVQPLQLAPLAPVQPFALLAVSDDDDTSDLTFTVALDDPAKGVLTHLAGVGGSFVEDPAGSGRYQMTGTPDDVTSVLAGLEFVVGDTYVFPPNEPGGTTFTLQAVDASLNTTTVDLAIVLQNEPRNHLVIDDSDEVYPEDHPVVDDRGRSRHGTLRRAVEEAGNNDVITFALPSYPALIRLDSTRGPLVLTRNLTLKGPGADLLTLSGDSRGDRNPATQTRILTVLAQVTVEGVSLADGFAVSGGAASVGPTGDLRLRYCAVLNSGATQWGGGIDVDGGRLNVANSLFRGNFTDSSLGLGGGAIALYTTQPCAIANSTFSANRQSAANGFGGGALYVEISDPSSHLLVDVAHCTFAENLDGSRRGSALVANVLNTVVTVRNSVVADGQDRNLGVQGAGRIVSAGGNLSDDTTRAILTQGGIPKEIFLFDHTTDRAPANPQLGPFDDRRLTPVGGYPLLPGSPAVGHAVIPSPAIDQRGARRDSAPDSGAFELGASARIVLNEIQHADVPADFLEFYVLRDSIPFDLSGYAVRVDGQTRHIFPADTLVRPGFGILVADMAIAAFGGTPVQTPDDGDASTSSDMLHLDARGVVELRAPGTAGALILTASFVGVYADPEDPANDLDVGTDSLTLAPQFRGFAYVPHSFALDPPLGGVDPTIPDGTDPDSPGADTGDTPFGSPNAFPNAIADAFVVGEDDLLLVPVLDNDSDADGSDRPVIIDLSVAAGDFDQDASLNTIGGAVASIDPSAAPLQGAAIFYDPRAAGSPLQTLAEGVERTDQFFYSVVDLGEGTITAAQSDPGDSSRTILLSAHHRLAPGQSVEIQGSSLAAYNGVHTVTLVDNDRFSIAIPFAGDPTEKGTWTTRLTLTSGSIAGFASASGGAAVTVTSTAHGLRNNDGVVITGAAIDTYNGLHVVSNVDADHFDIPAAFVADLTPRGSWSSTRSRIPTRISQTSVTLTVIGANDPPSPQPDFVPGSEETILRIFGDAILPADVQPRPSFDTDDDYPQTPDFAAVSLLANDTDVDSDDHSGTLRIVGVLSRVFPIAEFLGVPGESGVVVSNDLPHGLASGDTILISGYGGHPSYNGFHVVTVLDDHSFSLPIPFVDDAVPAGHWAILTDAGRLSAVSEHGAAVRLEIRVDRIETSIVYDPLPSSYLNGLAVGETENDTFYYAIQDSHGAVSFAAVTVQVAGVNDPPEPGADPSSLAGLPDDLDPADVLPDGTVNFYLPPASGLPNHADAEVTVGTAPNLFTLYLTDLWTTDEDTSVQITFDDLLANDTDVDRSDVANSRLQVVSVVGTQSSQGASLTFIGGAGHVLYNPSPALNNLAREEGILDTFEVIVSDGNGGNVPALVAVLVIGLNDPPDAQNDVASTTEDAAVTVFPLLNDSDPDVNGVPPDNQLRLLPAPTTTTTKGALVTIGTETMVYDPSGSAYFNSLTHGYVDPNPESIPYTVADSSFIFANDDMYKVQADGSDFDLNLLANDRNLSGSGGALRILSVGTPNRDGIVAINAAGDGVSYTPLANFVGDEVFPYTVSDEDGNTDRAFVVVRVSVNQLNGNLQANADYFSLALGESAVLDVLANDNVLPASGANLTITRIVSSPAQDEVELIDNQITYRQTSPAAGYQTSFTYEVSGGGTARALAIAQVNVVDRRNTLPVRPDSFSVAAELAHQPLDVLANDSILPGSPVILKVTQVAQPPDHGTVTIADDGSQLLYTPEPGYVGEDSLAYEASDGYGGTGTTQVAIAVGALSTSIDFFAVPYDDPSALDHSVETTLDVLANDRVLAASPANLEITSVEAPPVALGTLRIADNRKSLLFNPATGAEGEATVRYTLRDGALPLAGRTADGFVTLVIVREGVRANADFFSVEVGSVENTLPVLGNDAAIPDRNRRLAIVGIGTGLNAPNHGGAVRINETGDSLVYAPAAGFSGEETFTYTMTDSRTTDTTKVVVRVVSGALSANDDAYTVFRATTAAGDTVSFTLPVLANDRVSPDAGQVLTITGVGIDDRVNDPNAPDMDGDVQISPDGTSLIYTPLQATATDYTEHFTYEISDGTARRAQGHVLVNVQFRDDLRDMETHDDAFTVERNSVANALPVLANDDIRPASAAGWTISQSGPTSHGGILTVRGSTILYTPQPGFVGTETFTYAVSDGAGGTGTATVRVKVGDLPLCPDHFSVLSGSVDNALDVLANDAIRPDLPDTSFHLNAISTPPSRGVATLNGSVVLYTPTGGGPYPYTDSFIYDVRDDSGGIARSVATVQVFQTGSDRDTATVTISVQGVNDPPVITGTRCCFEVYQRGSVRPFAGVTLIEYDAIPAPEILTLEIIVSDPTHGFLSNASGANLDPDGDGRYLFTGIADELTTLVRSLVFVPTVGDPPRLSAGGQESTQLTLKLSDGRVTVTDDITSVITRHPEVTRLRASDGSSADEFGFSVGASRRVVSSGAPFDDDAMIQGSGNKTGSAYLYEWDAPTPNAWGQVAKVVANSRSIGDEFGYSTDVNQDGTVLAVGARRTKTGSATTGAAHIFRRAAGASGGWAEVIRLPATGLASGDEFGYDIALSPGGDLVVVGAPHHQPPSSSRTGAAFVFARSSTPVETWTHVATLRPTDGASDNEFGRTVSVDGAVIAVGSPRHRPTNRTSGATYLFWRGPQGTGSWVQLAKVVPTTGDNGDEFGHSVAVSGGWLAVGARLDEANGKKSGTTYVFRQSAGTPGTWTQSAMLQSPSSGTDDEFGFSVGLDGQFLVVGARRESVAGRRAGAIYVHGRDQGGPGAWGLLERLIPSTVDQDDEFGFSVALRQGLLAVGARRQQADGKRFGATYVYQFRFNNAPLSREPLPPVIAFIEQPFDYQVPVEIFADPDVGDAIVGYQAALADGQPLPSWLAFDGATARFTSVSNPTPLDVGVLPLRVTALDQDGVGASVEFELHVEVASAFLASAIPNPSVALAWSLAHAETLHIPAASASMSLLGAMEDPDGDGRNNLEEYARASNPFGATDDGEAGSLVVVRSAEGTGVLLHLRRRTDDPRLQYLVEMSADFRTWSPLQVSSPPSIRQVSDRIDEASVWVPVDDASRATYFRVRMDYR